MLFPRFLNDFHAVLGLVLGQERHDNGFCSERCPVENRRRKRRELIRKCWKRLINYIENNVMQ